MLFHEMKELFEISEFEYENLLKEGHWLISKRFVKMQFFSRMPPNDITSYQIEYRYDNRWKVLKRI